MGVYAPVLLGWGLPVLLGWGLAVLVDRRCRRRARKWAERPDWAEQAAALARINDQANQLRTWSSTASDPERRWAEDRGRDLLLSLLEPEQVQTYEEFDFVQVTTASGRRVRLYQRFYFRTPVVLELMPADGVSLLPLHKDYVVTIQGERVVPMAHCVHVDPWPPLPMTDQMVGLLLWLRYDERGFWAKANPMGFVALPTHQHAVA